MSRKNSTMLAGVILCLAVLSAYVLTYVVLMESGSVNWWAPQHAFRYSDNQRINRAVGRFFYPAYKMHNEMTGIVWLDHEPLMLPARSPAATSLPIDSSGSAAASASDPASPVVSNSVDERFVRLDMPRAGVVVYAPSSVAAVKAERGEANVEAAWADRTVANGAVTLADGTVITVGTVVEIGGVKYTRKPDEAVLFLTILPGGGVVKGTPVFENRFGGDDPFSSLYAKRQNVALYSYQKVRTVETGDGISRYDMFLWGKCIESTASVLLADGTRIRIGDRIEVDGKVLGELSVDTSGPRCVRMLGKGHIDVGSRPAWQGNPTYMSVWRLDQSIRQYFTAHSCLPNSINDMDGAGSATAPRDEWGGAIDYAVDGKGAAVLTSYGRYGRQGGRPHLMRFIYVGQSSADPNMPLE